MQLSIAQVVVLTGKRPTFLAAQRAQEEDPGHARWETLEVDGKQYHSRFHEYFYIEPPKAKPHKPIITGIPGQVSTSLALLGISPPYNEKDVTRAYKRLAKVAHPDAGGSHDEFIRLKNARDVALRGY
jgi:hypothetical protein